MLGSFGVSHSLHLSAQHGEASGDNKPWTCHAMLALIVPVTSITSEETCGGTWQSVCLHRPRTVTADSLL